MTVTIRRLGREDAALFRAIRLEALATDPAAFASSLADWRDRPLADWENRMTAMPTFAALRDEDAVGTMGWMRERYARLAHRALLVGVYVTPAVRGTGLARRLLDRVLGAARAEGILQMELGVSTATPRAQAFYARAGFAQVGRIPGAYRDGDILTDEVLMARWLDTGAADA